MAKTAIFFGLILFAACSAVSRPSSEPMEANRVAIVPKAVETKIEVQNTEPVPEPETKPEPTKIAEIIEPPFSWYEQAELLADREYLKDAFKRFKYSPPSRTFLVAGEVVKGAGQPAHKYYSLGDTAFTHSEGNFWPASTVKLLAALGALHTLGKYGLTGSARLDFEDDRGHFKGTASTLYGSALTKSNNKAYDWLVKIAGFDGINVELFSAENGFPNVKLQCSYDPSATSDFRTSSEIKFKERDLEGTIPKRKSDVVFEKCPEGSNCLTLFELLDALRRVVLHKEIPEEDRFKLQATDVSGLKRALGKSKCRVQEGAQSGLGHPVECFNKAGWYPDADQNDHAFIVDTMTGRRYLISQSIPHHEKEATAAEMTELAANTLRAAARAKWKGPLLQRTAGLVIRVNLEGEELDDGAVEISAGVEGSVDRFELWQNRDLVAKTDGSEIKATLTAPFERTLFVAQAFKGKKLVGYRSFSILAAGKF